MKATALLFTLAVLLVPAVSTAADETGQTAQVSVRTMYLDESGNLSVLDLAKENSVKWLREAVAAGQQRLAAELPAALGVEKVDIDLVSVPRTDRPETMNKVFVQWKQEINPASFVPLFGRAVSQKLDVFVALEARVSAPGRSPMIFSGQAHTQVERKSGSSALFEALESAGTPLFNEAISQAIASALSTHKNTP